MKPLTESQIAELAAQLRVLATEIAESLAVGRDGAKPVDLDEPIGRISRMDAIQQQQMARASREALLLRQKLVEAALNAVDHDRYGDCAVCEEPIGYGRLKARPEARLCVECQSANERR